MVWGTRQDFSCLVPINFKEMRTQLLALFILSLPFAVYSQEKTLYQGEWENDSYFTTFEGNWQIVQRGEDMYVVLADNFEAKKAPDLKIFLSKHDYSDISAKNAADSKTSVLVAQLTKYKGKSSYKIPAGTDLSAYKSILVHCEKYSKLWGGSQLNPDN